MPRNGSGTYSLPAGNPVVSGTVIASSGWGNPTMSDIASALTSSIAKDGQTVPTANLPMGNFAHTGVSAATARTQYARAAEVQDGTIVYLTTVAGTNTITASAALGMAAYVAGQTFCFIPANTNTGATTIQINGIAPAQNVFYNGAACVGGELVAAVPAQIIYDGTRFHVLNSKQIPRVLQIVHATDAGSSHSSTSNTNLNTASIPFTPRSASSRILIEVSANFRVGNVAAVNAIATLSIYETVAGTALSGERTIEAFSAAGGLGAAAPGIIRVQVNSTGVIARTFGLQGRVNNASSVVAGTGMVWTITEYLA